MFTNNYLHCFQVFQISSVNGKPFLELSSKKHNKTVILDDLWNIFWIYSILDEYYHKTKKFEFLVAYYICTLYNVILGIARNFLETSFVIIFIMEKESIHCSGNIKIFSIEL